MAVECILLDNELIACLSDQSRGSYVLFLKLAEEHNITVGKLSDIIFSRGLYAYVGSAMGGIKTRLGSHLKRGNRLYWHIDYLAEKAMIVGVMICETNCRCECNLARLLGTQFDSVPGFGASDCNCRSHLFYSSSEESMIAGVTAAIASLKQSF